MAIMNLPTFDLQRPHSNKEIEETKEEVRVR